MQRNPIPLWLRLTLQAALLLSSVALLRAGSARANDSSLETLRALSRFHSRHPVRVHEEARVVAIGGGTLGDKAERLIERVPEAKAFSENSPVPIESPVRAAIGEELIAPFMPHNQLGPALRGIPFAPDLSQRIRNGTLTGDQLQLLAHLGAVFGPIPLAFRSSAQGDARGTGTYHTAFGRAIDREMAEDFRDVLASYFSESAFAFRRDASTGEGFGMLSEPLVGEDLDTFFMPPLSGYGYTSTARGPGYLSIVPGLGGGVTSRFGERITRDRLEPYGGMLNAYAWDRRMVINLEDPTPRRSDFLAIEDSSYSGWHDAMTLVWRYGVPRSLLVQNTINLEDHYKPQLDALNLNPVFDHVEQMETRFGKPQYFEWALSFRGMSPVLWLLQIADVDKTLDPLEFGDHGQPLLHCHSVVGSGLVKTTQLVKCMQPSDVERLYRFNQQNNHYVLLFSGSLSSRQQRDVTFEYANFSNASVLIELQDTTHVKSSIAHLDGQLEATGKLFGIVDRSPIRAPDWEGLTTLQTNREDGLAVSRANFTVLANERRDEMIVYGNP